MDLTPTQQTGANVRAEMARKGVSQEELAARLGFSQSVVSKRLRGITPFDINELTLIAQHLGVPLASLLPAEAVAA